jgi:hypothetical protein
VAAPVRRKSEASVDGADGVVVQLNHHPVRDNWKLRVFFLNVADTPPGQEGQFRFVEFL